jgi:hypothetical protein
LLLAVAITLVTVVVAAVIMWRAFEGADDTTPRLATAAAAEGLGATVSSLASTASVAELESCPAGDDLLADVAMALGTEPLGDVVATGDVTTRVSLVGRPPAALVECTATRGEDELRVAVSAAPAALLAAARGEEAADWQDLGSTNGGTYSGRCELDECVVIWSDDELLALIGVEGPAAAVLDVRQVQAVLAAALPTVVAGLAM